MKKITALLSVIIVVSLFAAVIPAVADTDTVFPITEGFENAATLADTFFTSGAQVKKITESKTIIGKKSLLVQNRSADNITLLQLNSSKATLKPDTDYILSFYYRIDKPADMNQMKLFIGDRFLHWNSSSLEVLSGDKDLKNGLQLKSNSSYKELTLEFHTDSNGGETGFKLVGAIKSAGPLKIMLDQIIIRKKSVAVLDPNVDFENDIYDLSTDTVYYSNAAIQTVVSSNAINGKKSLYVQNQPSQFLCLLALNQSKLALEADTRYALSFNYRLDKPEDMPGLQIIIGEGDKKRYVRFDCLKNTAYEGNTELVSAAAIQSSKDGRYVHVKLRFRTAADGSEKCFSLEGDILGQTEIKVTLDDIALEEIPDGIVYNKNENFEKSDSLDNTIYESAMSEQKITWNNTIAGSKSLLLENEPAAWAVILKLDALKYSLKPNTKYNFSFSYRLEKSADMIAMQFCTANRYSRWSNETLAVYEGNEEIAASTVIRRDDKKGIYYFSVNFTTASSGEDSFWLQGDTVGENPLKMMIDDISLSELDPNAVYSANEKFEDENCLSQMAYYTFLPNRLVSGENAISGNGSLEISNEEGGWEEALALSTDKFKLRPGSTYLFSFICKTENIKYLQFQLEGIYSASYLRIKPSRMGVSSGDMYSFNYAVSEINGGASKVEFTFRATEHNNMLKLYMKTDKNKNAVLVIDDINLKTTADEITGAVKKLSASSGNSDTDSKINATSPPMGDNSRTVFLTFIIIISSGLLIILKKQIKYDGEKT